MLPDQEDNVTSHPMLLPAMPFLGGQYPLELKTKITLPSFLRLLLGMYLVTTIGKAINTPTSIAEGTDG